VLSDQGAESLYNSNLEQSLLESDCDSKNSADDYVLTYW